MGSSKCRYQGVQNVTKPPYITVSNNIPEDAFVVFSHT